MHAGLREIYPLGFSSKLDDYPSVMDKSTEKSLFLKFFLALSLDVPPSLFAFSEEFVAVSMNAFLALLSSAGVPFDYSLE